MNIEEKVKEIKLLYTNISIYVFVSLSCIILWLSMGCGPFWPAWVIFGLMIAAGLEAFRIGHLSCLEEILPFLRREWEEEQKNRLELMTKNSSVLKDEKKQNPVKKIKEKKEPMLEK